MKTRRFDDTYTVLEIYELNDRRFPFWIRSYRSPLTLLLVTGIGMNNHFIGNRYSLDKNNLLACALIARNDGQKGWVPG